MRLFLVSLVVLSSAAMAQEEQAKTLKDALAKGEPSVSLRYRFEIVDQVRFEKNAYASTLRTVISYRTLPFKGFSAFLEAQNVATPGKDLFDNRGAGDLGNGATDRPDVVDPSQTRMHQACLRLDALETTFDFGRREITYGDHRFIGNVGWRRNHQTLDAVHVSSRALERSTVSYALPTRSCRSPGRRKT